VERCPDPRRWGDIERSPKKSAYLVLWGGGRQTRSLGSTYIQNKLVVGRGAEGHCGQMKASRVVQKSFRCRAPKTRFLTMGNEHRGGGVGTGVKKGRGARNFVSFKIFIRKRGVLAPWGCAGERGKKNSTTYSPRLQITSNQERGRN